MLKHLIIPIFGKDIEDRNSAIRLLGLKISTTILKISRHNLFRLSTYVLFDAAFQFQEFSYRYSYVRLNSIEWSQ